MHFIFVIVINAVFTVIISSLIVVYIKTFFEPGVDSKFTDISKQLGDIRNQLDETRGQISTDRNELTNIKENIHSVVLPIANKYVQSEFELAKSKFEQFLSFIF